MEQQYINSPMSSSQSQNGSKTPRYDWNEHLPKMISLYLEGMPLPEIYKAIQDEATDFTPK